jgi:hypothetical protein
MRVECYEIGRPTDTHGVWVALLPDDAIVLGVGIEKAQPVVRALVCDQHTRQRVRHFLLVGTGEEFSFSIIADQDYLGTLFNETGAKYEDPIYRSGGFDPPTPLHVFDLGWGA